MKERKAEQLFKDRTEVFAKSYFDLFGDSFRKDWCSSLKLKQIYEEIIKSEVVSKIKVKMPFRGGPAL